MKNILLVLFLFALLSCSNSARPKKTQPKKTVEVIKQAKALSQESAVALKKDTITKKDEVFPLERPEAVGYWQVQSYVWDTTTRVVSVVFPSVFKYDGAYVTIAPLMVINGTPWSTPSYYSKDGYYRFKATWHGDSLFYRSIWQENEFVAIFADSVFVKPDEYSKSAHDWIYNKINRAQIPEYSKAVALKRKPFDYSKLDR